MKNVILFHGTGCTPESYWFPYVKNELENKGYSVWIPQLPDADNPSLKKWLPYALENGAFSDETVLIGHSAGCPLILSILENLNTPVCKAILVSGYARSLGEGSEPILQKEYNWGKIKNNAKEFVFINSDNDPWGCDDKEGAYMFTHLGGTQIIKHGEGHMGSDSFHQPYKTFPLIVSFATNQQWER